MIVCQHDDHRGCGPCLPWAGKPSLTSGNDAETLANTGSERVGLAENESGPGAVDAAPAQANPDITGADNA